MCVLCFCTTFYLRAGPTAAAARMSRDVRQPKKHEHPVLPLMVRAPRGPQHPVRSQSSPPALTHPLPPSLGRAPRRSHNLLMPKEDRAQKKLVFFCKPCNYTQDAETPIVFRHEVIKSERCASFAAASAAPPLQQASSPLRAPRSPASRAPRLPLRTPPPRRAATSSQRCPTTSSPTPPLCASA